MTPRALPPAGRPTELSHGDQRALVTQSGATLRSYEVGSRPVIEAFDGPGSVGIGCQGEVLLPWPNRVADGRWTRLGTAHQLSLTEPERGHAIHGLVRALTWTVVERRPDAVEMEVLLLAQPGWPFPLHCAVSYSLGPEGLASTIEATNAGRRPCPYGAATHPYLAVAGGDVDACVVHLPAATWVETDDRLIPVGRRRTAGGPFDFGDGAPIGSRRVDTAFTDLPVGPDGRTEVRITAPDGRATVVWGDAGVRWWQLFTGDTLPAPWRRTTLAVEPMTCAPDALNSHDGLVFLEPGQSHSMTWGITPPGATTGPPPAAPGGYQESTPSSTARISSP